jgi:glutamate dehydrogenase/leucine dehydrogenase
MKNNPFENSQKQLQSIAEKLEMEDSIIDQLMEPDRIVEVSIPIKMDNGTTRVFKGFRSQHNNARGPYKGGIRYHQNVSKDEIKAFSMWMSWKSGIIGLPYGGGKGGIIVNPHELSQGELEGLSRGFIRKIYDFIGPNTDVPAPDVNTDGQIMSWFVDEYSTISRELVPAAFTGKPVEIGGSLGRESATGRGATFMLDKLQERENLDPKDTSIAIQGFGNAGYWFARLAEERGYKIVAISDSKGGIYKESGFDIEGAKSHKDTQGQLHGFDGDFISNEELLELEVEVLVPAALENAITKENADNISASYIIEIANGPTTHEADEILSDKNILVVPDILANAGGVTVSYFEWVQNNQGFYWEEEEVNKRLEKLMKKAFDKGFRIFDDRDDLNSRMAVYSIAVKEVADAIKLKGNN